MGGWPDHYSPPMCLSFPTLQVAFHAHWLSDRATASRLASALPPGISSAADVLTAIESGVLDVGTLLDRLRRVHTMPAGTALADAAPLQATHLAAQGSSRLLATPPPPIVLPDAGAA